MFIVDPAGFVYTNIKEEELEEQFPDKYYIKQRIGGAVKLKFCDPYAQKMAVRLRNLIEELGR